MGINRDYCFRPLSRYIGLYLPTYLKFKTTFGCFRPLSMYIGLYRYSIKINDWELGRFPSPLEVYRFISNDGNFE